MQTRAEFAGALTVGCLASVTVVALCFFSGLTGVVGYFGSFLPHLCLALVLSGMLFQLLGARLRARLAFATGLLGLLGALGPLIATAASPAGTNFAARTQVDITSFNVLETNDINAAKIADTIIKSKSDVYVVMEARPIKPFLSRIETAFPYRTGCAGSDPCDLVVFSRLPMEGSEIRSAGRIYPNRIIRLALVKDGIPFILVASHITKPFLEEWGLEELEWLASYLNKQTGPLIVAGDFNQASWSPMLAKFLRITSLRPALFEPATFPSTAGAFGIPIDHVLGRAPARVQSVEALPFAFGSNHRGLHAIVAIQ